MVDIEFDYLQDKITMKFNLTDDFNSVFDKYYQKANIEPNSVVFMAHAMTIPKDKKIIDIMDTSEKLTNKIYISVFPLYLNNNQVFEQSKEIICPKCSEQCIIKIKDYLVELYCYKCNHSTFMRLDEFKDSQKLDLAKIKCEICNVKNMGNSFDHVFFYCQNCKTKTKTETKTEKDYKVIESFYHTAKNLIIILNYGENCENKTSIDFEEEMELNQSYKYQLVGVIELLEDGNYISFTRTENNSWSYNEYKNNLMPFDAIKNIGKIVALFYYCNNQGFVLNLKFLVCQQYNLILTEVWQVVLFFSFC